MVISLVTGVFFVLFFVGGDGNWGNSLKNVSYKFATNKIIIKQLSVLSYSKTSCF